MAKKLPAPQKPIRKGEAAMLDTKRQVEIDRAINVGRAWRGEITDEEYEKRRRANEAQLLGNVWHSPDARDTNLPVEKKKTRRK
jgi:hypothetical protein